MDDDAPLSVLASVKAKPVKKTGDDDTPLAALAAKPAAKAGAGQKGGAAAAAKGKGKGKGKRKRGSSSSSSYSSSSSSSESGAKKKGPKKGGSKNKLLRKKSSGGTSAEDIDGGGPVRKKDKSLKDQIVAELLCRWWYALPDWPPPMNDKYWTEQLEKRNLRQVQIEEWEWVPDEDSKGRKKVYGLTQFRGVYRNSSGDFIDLRPHDTCPCQRNMMKKGLPELYDLLIKAYENQIADLKNSKYDETMLEAQLKATLTRHRDKAAQARQVGSVKR
eukprot:TRINITY_DN8947_c3_g1_i1.p1 TRINITY_DN8947_c3_g1~~TRINITY_DN8947_c3_g1_i1.p1  ORF type:complete len:274 (+),score=79.35 TRINITY_DN8947_c3_g1_i1:114-935(+)